MFTFCLKRKELIKRLEKAGFVFVRHGGKHDVYQRGKDEEQIPRIQKLTNFLQKAL